MNFFMMLAIFPVYSFWRQAGLKYQFISAAIHSFSIVNRKLNQDNPALPASTACNLQGTTAEGVGQAEDYAIPVLPFAIANCKQTSADPQHQFATVSK